MQGLSGRGAQPTSAAARSLTGGRRGRAELAAGARRASCARVRCVRSWAWPSPGPGPRRPREPEVRVRASSPTAPARAATGRGVAHTAAVLVPGHNAPVPAFAASPTSSTPNGAERHPPAVARDTSHRRPTTHPRRAPPRRPRRRSAHGPSVPPAAPRGATVRPLTPTPPALL
jgi:hypothetical protein